MTSPSSGVRPIDVSTATPAADRRRRAPLPRCSTIWFRSSSRRPSSSRRGLRDVLVRRAVEAVAADRVLRGEVAGDRVRRRPRRAACGRTRCRRRRRAGTSDSALARGLDARRRSAGLCSGARGSARRSAVDDRVVDDHRVGEVGPPCTTRWPTAPRCAALRSRTVARTASARAQAAPWSADRSRARVVVAGVRCWTTRSASPIRSTSPRRDAPSPPSGSTSWYLSDDEPELTTRTRPIARGIAHAVAVPAASTCPAPGWR